MSEPLSREERDNIISWCAWVESKITPTPHMQEDAREFARFEATIQVVEVERDALARRVEELRSALKEIGRVDVGGLQAIDEYVYDEKENRYQSVKHLLARVAWRRKVAFDAIAADDAARGDQ